MAAQQERFEAWGLVDLFGHVRVAGRISEQTIGGETFIRVDVPDDPKKPESCHTRLFGKGAIYSMTLTDEPIAREYAARSGARPVSAFELRKLLPSPADGEYDDSTFAHHSGEFAEND